MPLGLLFILLIAFVFVALGVSVGSSLQDMQGFQLIMRFLVMPIFFFSGALFPLDHLPRGLAALTTIDPLSYGVDGLRATLIGAMHFGVLLDLAVLAPISIVLIYPDGGLAHSAVVDALDSTAVDEYDGIARQTQNTRKLSPAASFKRLGIGSKFSKEEGP